MVLFSHRYQVRRYRKNYKIFLFFTIGKRGFNPYISAGGYTGKNNDFFKKANEHLSLGIILEGREAFENIDEILANEQIDIVYIGQYDLSVALDVPGDITNPKVLDMMKVSVEK